MASPQLKNGYIKIANELIEAIMKQNLSGQEFRVLFCIIRKTYGYNKIEDFISLSQIKKLTGLQKIRCSQLLHSLINKKIITLAENLKGVINKIHFNKDFEQWDSPLKVRPFNKSARVPFNKTARDPLSFTHEPFKKTATTYNNTTKDIFKNILPTYCEFFKLKYGENPTITGKDARIAKRISKLEDCELLLERYFQSTDPFIIKNAHSLGIFESKINQLRVRGQGEFTGIKEWLNEKQ